MDSEKQEQEATSVTSPVSKPALGHEYRVVWQREGLPKRRKLYQTLKGAEDCAGVQENATADMEWVTPPIPEIVSGPEIEVWLVGSWMPHTWNEMKQALRHKRRSLVALPSVPAPKATPRKETHE